MEITIAADNGSTLEEIIAITEFDRDVFSLVEPNRQAMRTHGMVEVSAAISAAGGVAAILNRLDRLVRYCIDHSKKAEIQVGGFGIHVAANWERFDPGKARTTKSSRADEREASPYD
jgi:hypothetical protein